ncbi:quinone oxidoreductase [Cutibacterium acnes JCM 18916]|nr:quinone oxidoreductase [Cutibacterium acnes JCM 18916]
MHAITVRPTDKTDSKGRHRPGPECIEWTEVPTPKPGPGEVLVKVKAAGINRGDLLQRQGLYPPPKGVSETMGLEVTGVISSLGQDVTGWSEDDEVIALLAGGGYAEYVIVPAGQLLPIPEGIDPVTASTLIEVTATVISNMDHVGLARGETFLVHGGAGGIGQFAIQYAKSLECTVITTCGTARSRSSAALSVPTSPSTITRTGLPASKTLRGVVVPTSSSTSWALSTSTSTSMLSLLAGVSTSLECRAASRESSILQSFSTSAPSSPLLACGLAPLKKKAKICQRVREVAWPLYTNGSIKPAPVESFPMSEAGRAHERLESGEVLGKVALTL